MDVKDGKGMAESVFNKVRPCLERVMVDDGEKGLVGDFKNG